MNKLIVSNFPVGTTEDELADIFRDYAVQSINLFPGKYAVVTFDSWEEADKAMREWAGRVMDGQWLRVKWANW